jgi:hypothetical protein
VRRSRNGARGGSRSDKTNSKSRISTALQPALRANQNKRNNQSAKSDYRILPTFGDPRVVNAFLAALRDALDDEREEFDGSGERLSAERFADLVKRKMDEFLRVVEKIGDACVGDLEETDFAKDEHLSVKSLEVAHRVARKSANEGGEWYRP